MSKQIVEGLLFQAFGFLFYSLLIYTICKETKRDDGESYDSWLADVVDKTLLQ